MHKWGLCMKWCLSVTFVYSVETHKHIFRKIFTVGQPHHSSFLIPNVMAILRWEPPNWGKNHNFWQLSGFDMLDVEYRVSGGICWSRLMDDALSCISKACLWQKASTLHQRQQNLIVRIGKSEAEVTNIWRLHSRYCNIEASYRQTRSIAQPLCDSRASCSKK